MREEVRQELQRKGIRAEQDYNTTARAVRLKGQVRLITQCEAILQAISWRRQDELNEHELALRDYVRQFIDLQQDHITKEKVA